jgi:hypothetical protein
MKEDLKQPRKRMTGDEVMAHIFHPKAVKHIKKHVEKLSKEKEKVKK